MNSLQIEELKIVFPGDPNSSRHFAEVHELMQSVIRKLFNRSALATPIKDGIRILAMTFKDVSLPQDIPGGEWRLASAIANEYNKLAAQEGLPLVSVNERIDIASILLNPKKTLNKRTLIVTPQW